MQEGDSHFEEMMNAWDEVDHKPWMNVSPSTWAFKVEHFPDGSVKKLEA